MNIPQSEKGEKKRTSYQNESLKRRKEDYLINIYFQVILNTCL